MVPGKNGLRKSSPQKIGPRKIGPRKNFLQKLFSVKNMLGNLNDFFIFINSFHYTHIVRSWLYLEAKQKNTQNNSNLKTIT